MCSVPVNKYRMGSPSVFYALAETFERPVKVASPNPSYLWSIGKAEHTVEHRATLTKLFRQIRTD